MQTDTTEEYIFSLLGDLYDLDEFAEWLNNTQSLLGGERPHDLISRGDAQPVVSLAKQIRDGVYL